MLPRFEIRHTSEMQFGQIYLPRVNLLLAWSVMLRSSALVSPAPSRQPMAYRSRAKWL
ncbi:MAG: hypothetical protein E5X22_26535 [Mesorhizobium sp.]|nr:MAG: hypothetical protein EOQ79_28275 [Mesorhizobium sp.]TIR56826.1 MAG: hypothetical protein E5X22_26535 [Mesorhizobium sp.]TIR64854.1 MAG: hypothetical protein E5X24_28605 [Mesorhizobium sp.]